MFIVVSNSKVYIFQSETTAVNFCCTLSNLHKPVSLYSQLSSGSMDTYKYPASRLIDLMGGGQ